MATIDTIKDVLQENLDIDPSNVTPESTFETLGVDSLDLVELICELEDRLGIDFGEPEGLSTLADVVAHIDSL
ncbi:MAG: acyl carrier protein [Coriobacteriia bacterium]|nr:acyl carrier protein [Coriobacteriia bacterium]